MALQDAVEGVIEENARLGLPVYVRENGRIVAKDAKELLKRGATEKNPIKEELPAE